MKYYSQLAKLPVFNLSDAQRIIGKTSVSQNLNYMVEKGYIKRIRKNLYTCIDFSTDTDYANLYQIASKITDDSYVAYHSAFQFYGCYNQCYYDLQVCSSKRFQNFEYENDNYVYYLSNSNEQINIINGVRVTTIERTIVDSINMLGKVMDAEELTECLNLVESINEDKLLEMLEIYNKEILYRKVGYVLSFYKEKYKLNNNFFDICLKKGNIKNKGYLLNDYNLTYNSKWGLYAYKNIHDIYNQGVIDNV